jgi:hypothetical protein
VLRGWRGRRESWAWFMLVNYYNQEE